MGRILRSPATLFFLTAFACSFFVGKYVPPTWTAERVVLNMQEDEEGHLYYVKEQDRIYVLRKDIVPIQQSVLSAENIAKLNTEHQSPKIKEEYATKDEKYYLLKAHQHWKLWSLLPALVALVLCWITKEPVTSLFGGIVVGAFLLGKYDITGMVLVPELSTKSAAGIIVLYLWLLGGLMGIWSRTGAAKAFADYMTKHFVRGPKSAKFVAWMLGVFFFQGGTVSTVLVGTTVRPIADEEGVSHEELSYVVDSTASPIASLLAFNAWPAYVQAFIYVPGVSWLATETDRIKFFFKGVPFSFYAIFAVLGTFLLTIEKAPFLGKKMRAAIARSRATGELDAPGAEPLNAAELLGNKVPENYEPSPWEFIAPLLLLIGIAVGTFFYYGSPNVRWAFGFALILSAATALFKGMSMSELLDGVASGLKGVVLGSVILLLAIVIGSISKETGGGIYLVESLKETIPYWALPVILQLITVITAFSTGTSWGTYAITFPLAMPLSWAIANNQDLAHPEFFMVICFAAVMGGSVYGDQCSPISDTTVLSSMCTGCDLMDHVKTQIPQATAAAILSSIGWTCAVYFFS